MEFFEVSTNTEGGREGASCRLSEIHLLSFGLRGRLKTTVYAAVLMTAAGTVVQLFIYSFWLE